jgi:hypothetical protein
MSDYEVARIISPEIALNKEMKFDRSELAIRPPQTQKTVNKQNNLNDRLEAYQGESLQ